jgi:hypothetical protein
MVGIPDGLGAHRNGNGTTTVYMNHEIGEPLNKGAIVSKLTVDRRGKVVSAERVTGPRLLVQSL